MAAAGNGCYLLAMPEPVYAGGCLCGAVRYEARGTARYLCLCHCRSCRRAAGAPLVAWGTFARGQLRITRGALTEFASSAGVQRGFCARCGTPLTFRKEANPQDIDITLASLDEPAALAPQMHVWVQDKLPWVSIEDGLPQHPAGTPPEADATA
jgi:hypothetical protein